jgi:hypothetical protein
VKDRTSEVNVLCEAERSQVNVTLLAGYWDPKGFQLRFLNSIALEWQLAAKTPNVFENFNQ